jgi:hypothetical protein
MHGTNVKIISGVKLSAIKMSVVVGRVLEEGYYPLQRLIAVLCNAKFMNTCR